MSEKNLFDSNWIDIDDQDSNPDTASINLDKLRESIHSSDSDDSIFIPELVENRIASSLYSSKNDSAAAKDESDNRSGKGMAFLRPLAIAALLLVLVYAGYRGYKLLASSPAKPAERTILSNVYVAGVNVGGLYRSQAVSAVTEHLEQTLYAVPMQVNLPDSSLSIDPEDIGLYLDVQAAVDAAMEYGRTGPDAEAQVIAANNGEVFQVDILPCLRFNEDLLHEVLTKAADSVIGEFQPSGYFLEGTAPALDAEHFDANAPCQSLVLRKGVPGVGIDPDSLYSDILTAYSNGITAVSITNAATQRIPKELDLNLIHRILTISPRDAVLDSKTLTIIPGVYGYSFDLDAASAALKNAAYGSEVIVPMEYIAPGVQSDGVYCTDELASTTLKCSPSAFPNLAAACSTVHTTVIPAGKQYHYRIPAAMHNKAENCQKAPVNDDGFCMFASALYQSALTAGLKTSSVTHHAYYPDYCEKGLDVRITRDNNLSIRNPGSSPVMILVDVDIDSFTVRILGTKTGTSSISLTSQLVSEQDFTVTKRVVAPESGYTNGQVLQEGMNAAAYEIHLTTVDPQSGAVLSDEIIQTVRYPGRPEIVARVTK